MRAPSSSLLASSGIAMGAATASIAIAVMLLASNFAIINAQPQELNGEPGEIENGSTTPFQSTSDSFSIQVPSGWIIQDIDNAGAAQLDEVRQGYGILMQLCPEEQAAAAPPPASATTANGGSINTISSINASRCLGAQEVIHIIRYPDLDTRLSANNATTTATNNNMTTATTIDNILTYHLQKLQDVGYRSMRIVNNTDITLNLLDPQTNETLTTVPARLVEMTYGTNFAPNEMKRGYFILTAADETVPNAGTTKGYSIFYESNSTTPTTPAEITTAAASLPLSTAAGEVFDSFELIAAPEVAQALAETGEDEDEDEDNGGDEDNGAEDEDEDNGAEDNDEDNDDGNNGEGNEGEGNEGEGNEGEGNEGNNPNEFDDCVVPPGRDPDDVGC